MFHAQPEPPVYEKQMVETDQKYPSNGGMVNQPSGVPTMGIPAQYINPSGMGNQPYVAQIARPVIINQPRSNGTSGLCDCMNDVEYGCVMSGMLYVLICCLFWTPCVYSCTFWAKIRSKFGLPDAPAPNWITRAGLEGKPPKLRIRASKLVGPALWITHCFCEYCALCQEYRELKNRGLDPSIGKLLTVYEFHSQIIYQSTLYYKRIHKELTGEDYVSDYDGDDNLSTSYSSDEDKG
uniref:Uncharacterized protein n=1 Tax=Brassica oleracea var. oleracea TaxID=109376 RepID=A0A0D3CFR3_BRAOL